MACRRRQQGVLAAWPPPSGSSAASSVVASAGLALRPDQRMSVATDEDPAEGHDQHAPRAVLVACRAATVVTVAVMVDVMAGKVGGRAMVAPPSSNTQRKINQKEV